MELKTPDEYLDLVLSRITDISSFSVWKLLDFDFESQTEEMKRSMLEMSRTVQNLGIAHKYFIEISPQILRLDDKGIEAKKIGGHFAYERSMRKSHFTRYQIVYLTLFTLFGSFGLYKTFLPCVSKSDFENLRSQYDLVKSDSVVLKEKYDSIVKTTLKPKPRQLNDTLQTKN